MRILLFLAGRLYSEVLQFHFADFLQARLCFQGNQNTAHSDPASVTLRFETTAGLLGGELDVKSCPVSLVWPSRGGSAGS